MNSGTNQEKKRFISIFENVYGCIQSSFRNGNYYIIDEGEQLVLIDTGNSKSFDEISAFLKTIGRDISNLTDILLTHADGDHVGSLNKLVKHSGATVWASQKTKEYLRNAKNPPHFPFPMNIVVQIAYKLFVGKNKVDKIVSDSELIDLLGGVQVISTPGHTDDHVSYYLKNKKILFAGDCLHNGTKVEIPPKIINSNHTELLASIKKILTIQADVVCVGHGSVWNKNNEESVEEINKLEQRIMNL